VTDLEARAKRVLSPVLGHYTWLPVARGEGSWLITNDDRRILDLTCGIAVTPVGHAHPKVVAAIRAQAEKLSHICAGVALYEPNVALAEELIKVTPQGLDTVFFGNSGAEAIEGSIKLARQVTRRNALIVFRGGFHGRSTGAMAVTTSKAAYRRGYGALLPDVYMAPFPYPLACPITPAHDAAACAEHCLAELDVLLEHHVPPEHVAAILIEPVLGEGGYIAPPAAFLVALRELATRIGALLIFDEVQTGFGRTGESFWGIESFGVRPDAIVCAKGLGNGMAIGAVVGRTDMVDSLSANSIATFGGNPIASTYALANLKHIVDNDLQHNAHRVGKFLYEGLKELEERYDVVGEVRGKGLMLGVELVKTSEGKEPSPEAANQVMEASKERGLLIGRGGLYGNVLRISPPLVITEEDAGRAIETIDAALGEVQGR